ncbi:MAG: hypothetical protein H7256_15240 [Bdellovibrio sp.]|nr:hypothetical protein [Bdellovibrio sp.]
MSFFKKLANIVGGSEPDIFDDKGQIAHKLPKKKWDDWQNRLIQSAEYNWREHKGSKAGEAEKTSEGLAETLKK